VPFERLSLIVLMSLLFLSAVTVTRQDSVPIDRTCRSRVKHVATGLFREFRFPRPDELTDDWWSHGTAQRTDAACKTATETTSKTTPLSFCRAGTPNEGSRCLH
jgi:hypothetical protein